MEIPTKLLLGCCENAMPVVATRTTMPVLECLRLEVGGGFVTAQATDTELSVVSSAPCQGELPPVCLPAHTLVGILKRVAADHVGFDLAADTVTIRDGMDTFDLQSTVADKFPAYATLADTQEWKVDGLAMARVLRRTEHAINRLEGTRWATIGALFELSPDRLNVVATDTIRLVFQSVAASGSGKWSGIVPGKAVAMIKKLANGPATIRASASSLEVCADGQRMVTKLLEGKFPPYRDIIPKSLPYSIALPTATFRAAVQKLRAVVTAESCRADCSIGGNVFAMKARSETGKAEASFPVLDYAGEPLSVSFDPDYLLEMILASESESVELKIAGDKKPAMFNGKDGYMELIMPMAE